MRVEKLKIKNFRNISDLCLEPCNGVNIIWADNAQGKTSLLEAIWLFCGDKSFRGAKESELISHGEDRLQLELNFNSGDRDQIAEIAYSKNEKIIRLNDIKLSSSSELGESFKSVIFSPDHLWIIKHGPEKRRKLLDTALCQMYPKYCKALEGYSKILRQRSMLLKDIYYHPSLIDTLDSWDIQAVEYGSYIAFMRSRYVDSLLKRACEIYSGISSGRENLTMKYSAGINVSCETKDRSEWRSMLSEAMIKAREDDLKYAQTTIGPHRDDLLVEIDGISARMFASQGQQRSCVLAIKLAECEIITAFSGEPPVVLLDDVLSELDKSRKDYLLSGLSGKQIFITCCDDFLLQSFKGGKIFSMKAGELFT